MSRHNRMPGRLLLAVLLMLGHVSISNSQELDVTPLKQTEVYAFPFGVTRSGRPLLSFITNDDLQLNDSKLRLLIVAGLDGSKHTPIAAMDLTRRFYTEERYRSLREKIAISVVPCGNPDGFAKGLRNDNGFGGNPALGYPPLGESYNSPTCPEAQYLWRWIGMHAPDIVVELTEGFERQLSFGEGLPEGSLAAELQERTIGGIGTVEAISISIAPGDNFPFGGIVDNLTDENLEVLVKHVRDKEGTARKELLSRSGRNALEVCQQLANVYGNELQTTAYIPAVACMAKLRHARMTNNVPAIEEIRELAEPYLSGAKPALTNKSSLTDVAGQILWSELYELTKDERALSLVVAAVERAFDEQGLPLDVMPGHNEMSDAVFMGCPILARAGRLTGQPRYFDMCLTHMRYMLKLNLRNDGLHQHSPLNETAWGRGNGFPALGLAFALEDIPTDHPGYDEVLEAYREHMAALKKYQDVTGAWHQVIDHPESYREFSCTSMITYAMARGVRAGWIDESDYNDAITKGWEAVKLRIRTDGELIDVCTGTGKMNSLRDYFDRTAVLGQDARGGAMAYLLAVEIAMRESERAKN